VARVVGSADVAGRRAAFFHAELRGARFITRMNAILDEIGGDLSKVDLSKLEEAKSREQLDQIWDSFWRERWWAYEVLMPVGAGMLAGSLIALARAGE
jgi:hypothetical protein